MQPMKRLINKFNNWLLPLLYPLTGFLRSVYLLDDPLSAVDSEVGLHIFKYAIKIGLRNATVILVTHQLQVIPCIFSAKLKILCNVTLVVSI